MSRESRQDKCVQVTAIEKTTGCICASPLTQNTKSIDCVKCNRKYHAKCLNLTPSKFDLKLWECPICFLNGEDPLSVPEETLFLGMITGQAHEIVKFKARPNYYKKHKLKVELRCVRLDGQSFQRIYWPDRIDVQFNGGTGFSIYPLETDSAQKRRRDESKIFRQVEASNVVEIVAVRLPQGDQYSYKISRENHLLGIFVVKTLEKPELCEKILKKKPFPSAKTLGWIKRDMNPSQEITMETMELTLTCPISSSCISVPVRGRLCNHLQCFDLDGMLACHTKKINSWMCPICKKNCHDMVVDQLLYNIIRSSNKRIKAIEFSGASYQRRLIELSESEPSDSSLEEIRQPPTTKRVKIEMIDTVRKKSQPLIKPKKKPKSLKTRTKALRQLELISISSSDSPEKSVKLDDSHSDMPSSNDVVEACEDLSVEEVEAIKEASTESLAGQTCLYYKPAEVIISDNSVEEAENIVDFANIKRESEKRKAAVELERLKNLFARGRFGFPRMITSEERRYSIELYRCFAKDQSEDEFQLL